MVWGHIGLESPQATNRDAEGVEGVESAPPQPTRGSGRASYAPPAGSGTKHQLKAIFEHFVLIFCNYTPVLLILEAEYHAITKLKRHYCMSSHGMGGGARAPCAPMDPPLQADFDRNEQGDLP